MLSRVFLYMWQLVKLLTHLDFCLDIDECLSSPSICESKSCENLYGSHRCNCPLPQLLIGNNCQCKYGDCGRTIESEVTIH